MYNLKIKKYEFTPLLQELFMQSIVMVFFRDILLFLNLHYYPILASPMLTVDFKNEFYNLKGVRP